jgi:hypothetical protein
MAMNSHGSIACVLGLCLLLGCGHQSRRHAATEATAKSPVGFVKGYTWGWWGRRGHYLGEPAEQSMRLLAETGTEWATIAFVAHMPDHTMPEIKFAADDPKMVTDAEIRRAIDLARRNKMKVALKPVFDPEDGKWRGTIIFRTPEGRTDFQKWTQWWQQYEQFMLHYARIAQEGKAELFCVGCELNTTERFEKEWRALIEKIRGVYTGPLTYSSAHMREGEIGWWDAVDIIGVGAYYTLGTEDDASLELMIESWKPHRERLRKLSVKWNRPIMFMEIGCRSAWGCQVWPGDCTHWEWPHDGELQARFYEAALQTFWDEPWFCGFSWWDWPARLYKKQQAKGDKQFYIYGKPAEQVLCRWYGKPRPYPGP